MPPIVFNGYEIPPIIYGPAGAVSALLLFRLGKLFVREAWNAHLYRRDMRSLNDHDMTGLANKQIAQDETALELPIYTDEAKEV